MAGAVTVPPSLWTLDYVPTVADWQAAFANVVTSAVSLVLHGDGVIDDAPAIQAALNSGPGVYMLPAGGIQIRCASALTVPIGCILMALDSQPSSPAGGTRLVFDLAVSTCVTLGGVNTSGTFTGSAGLRGVTVTRAPGAIPAGSIGIHVVDVYNVILDGCDSSRHARPYRFYSTGFGISAFLQDCFTSAATDAHIENNGYPELSFIGGRYGSPSGTGDVDCNAFIRLTGGATGPNGLVIDGAIFAQDNGRVATFLDFKNMGAGQGTQLIEWSAINCHVEQIGCVVQSDSTVTQISKLRLIGNSFLDNLGLAPFWSLNAATAISQLTIIGNDISVASFNFSPGQQFNGANIVGNEFDNGLVTITGVGNSTLEMSANTYNAGIAIAGSFLRAHVGGTLAGGAISNTATGPVMIDCVAGPSWTQGAAPTLRFGDLSTGIAYTPANTKSWWVLDGSAATYMFIITLTSKGTATGIAALGGLPFAANGNVAYAGGVCATVSNMAGLTSSVTLGAQAGSTLVNLYQTSATGSSQLTDANFTNTSSLQGSITYFM